MMTDVEAVTVSPEEYFMKRVGAIPYKPKAIFPSEMFLFYKLAYDFGPEDHIFESGTGMSTLFLSKLFPQVPITTIDINNGKLFTVRIKGVEAICADSIKLLPNLIKTSKAERIALLIDGPKQEPAVALALTCMKDHRVKFAAVHDLEERLVKDRFNTRCDKYRIKYGYMDKDVGAYLEKYPVGPGLTIFNYGEVTL